MSRERIYSLLDLPPSKFLPQPTTQPPNLTEFNPEPGWLKKLFEENEHLRAKRDRELSL